MDELKPLSKDEKAKIRGLAIHNLATRVILLAICLTLPIWFIPALLWSALRDWGFGMLLGWPQNFVDAVLGEPHQRSAILILANPNILKRAERPKSFFATRPTQSKGTDG